MIDNRGLCGRPTTLNHSQCCYLKIDLLDLVFAQFGFRAEGEDGCNDYVTPVAILGSEFHIASFGTQVRIQNSPLERSLHPPQLSQGKLQQRSPGASEPRTGASKVEKIAGGEPAAKPTQDCIAVA